MLDTKLELKELTEVDCLISQLMSEPLVFHQLYHDCNISHGPLLKEKDKKSMTKHVLFHLEARVLLLKSITSNDENLLNPVSVDEDQISKFKELCEILVDKIQDLIPKLNQKVVDFNAKLEILTNKISSSKSKAAEYSQLKSQKEGKIQEILGPHCPAEDLYLDSHLMSKIETAKLEYEQSKDNLKRLEETMQDLKTCCVQLVENLSLNERLYKKQKKQLETKFNLTKQMQQLYESFTNIVLHKQEENCIRIELKSPQHGKPLFVTFFFKWSQNGDALVSDVQTSDSNLFISDCVEHVLQLTNIRSCLTNIIARWHYYSSLKDQVLEIQQHLPADWVQHLNKLRIIVGKNANIICTLQLPSADQPNVALIDVRGDNSSNNCDIGPTNKEASLKEWVDFLEKYFALKD
ncbi:uncharacterized protein LOC115232421 [Argonauta hians]